MFPIQRVSADDQIASAQLQGATLLDRTVAYFGEHFGMNGPSNTPALIWVTDGDDLADCLYFWNLRVLRPLRLAAVPMVLLPAGAVKDWAHYASEFASILARPEGFSPDVVIGSTTVEDDGLRQLAVDLNLERSNEQIRAAHQHPAGIRKAPFTYLTHGDVRQAGREYRQWFTFRRRYGEQAQVLAQLFRDETVIRFSSPVPFTGEGATLVRLSGGPLDALPHRPSTAGLVREGATWHGSTLQLRTWALREYDFRIRVPRHADVVNVLLSETVQRFVLSDKGKIGQALHASRDCAVLLQPGAYEAVVELTTPRADRLREELLSLHSNGVMLDEAVADRLVAKWGHRSDRRYQAGKQIGKAYRSALEILVDHQWAERGFEVACTNCGVKTFVPMADVPTRGPAVCPGCQSHERYTAAGDQPQVFYRLDALVDRASDQGVLPHLLVVAALSVQDPDCSLLPGADLVFPDGHDPEVDIFGVHKAHVLAGEVKTSAAAFDESQLARDIDLSTRLRADVHLMAALDTVPEETETAARDLCRGAGMDLVVLGAAQLRPGSQ